MIPIADVTLREERVFHVRPQPALIGRDKEAAAKLCKASSLAGLGRTQCSEVADSSRVPESCRAANWMSDKSS
jgi:hypothetical protein